MKNPDSGGLAADPMAGPVGRSERLVALDVLRGVAVLGILVMNIYAFAMPFAAYANPLAWGGTEPLNLGTWIATHIVFDQKFMSIFSMLFGAGIVLMNERSLRKRQPFGRVFYRRQFWLLVIALLHAYLLWFGDILFFYAMIGMLVYAFRNAAPRTLVVVGCLLLLIAPLLSMGGGAYAEDLKARAEQLQEQQQAGVELTDEQLATVDEWTGMRSFVLPGEAEIAAELSAYTGSWLDGLTHRASFVASFQVDGLLYYMLWRVGGLMLIGMALMKTGILSGRRERSCYRHLMLAGYLVGLPITAWSAINAGVHEYDPLYMFRMGNAYNYVGSLVVAFGHIGLVMLAVASGWFERGLRRFAAVGQMALTNYLMHSIVMTALFYGWGLGLYGTVPRFWQMAFVAGLAGVQLMLSSWWLARFRFGPVEWLWRSLTYWRRQPMRLAGAGPASPG